MSAHRLRAFALLAQAPAVHEPGDERRRAPVGQFVAVLGPQEFCKTLVFQRLAPCDVAVLGEGDHRAGQVARVVLTEFGRRQRLPAATGSGMKERVFVGDVELAQVGDPHDLPRQVLEPGWPATAADAAEASSSSHGSGSGSDAMNRAPGSAGQVPFAARATAWRREPAGASGIWAVRAASSSSTVAASRSARTRRRIPVASTACSGFCRSKQQPGNWGRDRVPGGPARGSCWRCVRTGSRWPGPRTAMTSSRDSKEKSAVLTGRAAHAHRQEPAGGHGTAASPDGERGKLERQLVSSLRTKTRTRLTQTLPETTHTHPGHRQKRGICCPASHAAVLAVPSVAGDLRAIPIPLSPSVCDDQSGARVN